MQDESDRVGKAQLGQNQSFFKRACDACRARKVRCDKSSPCSACKASNIPCQTSAPEPKARRKRVHVTEEYEKKIDLIQSRLADLDHVLQPVEGSKRTSVPPTPPQNHSKTTPTSASDSPFTATFNASDIAEDERKAFEGGTSMRAHSAYAQRLLEKAVREVPLAASSPAMSSALASLRQLSAASSPQDKFSPNPSFKSPKDLKFDFRRLPLPPTDAVLEILRKAKGHELTMSLLEIPTLIFVDPFSFQDLPKLTELCKEVFFCLESFPVSTAILVFGHLYWLFGAFSGLNGEENTRLEYYSTICQSNLEVALSSIEVISSSTPDNINALLLGACYAIETSRPSMCWKLTAAAVSLAKTMGWHRSLDDDDPAQRRLKSHRFWFLYTLDKSLSLRLGRASSLQDYDIDVDLPDYGPDPFGQYSTKVTGLWIRTAKIQGLVYEQLYSPSALRQNPAVQRERANILLRDIESVRTELAEARNLGVQLPLPESGLSYKAVQLLSLSDETVVYVTFTMIYRAMPRENDQAPQLSAECLDHARAALEVHQRAATNHRDLGEEFWSFYLHWTVLHAPFVPFIVIFCNVLSNGSSDDLRRMEDFKETLDGGSEGVRRLHSLCTTLCQVGSLYVEAARQHVSSNSATPSSSYPDNTNAINAQAWGALNPYLNTLGYVGNPSVDNNAVMNDNLGDWFNGNQYMMGLLEDDISYLNPS